MSDNNRIYIDDIISRVKALSRSKSNIIIAIDGPCAGGKTSFASVLGERVGADVVHMDDFFLPEHLRTMERYNSPGGNVHYERFLEEVLLPVYENREYIYRPFDCKTMSIKSAQTKKVSAITVVEGSYSCHPELIKYYDLKIFIDVDRETQLQRIIKRNGQEKARIFASKWILLENLYFDAFNIKSCADIIISKYD